MSDQFTNEEEPREHEERMLRNNLAANAPTVPDWFVPEMPKRPKRPRQPDLGSQELNHTIYRWLHDPVCDLEFMFCDPLTGTYSIGDEVRRTLRDYESALASWQDERTRWEYERERQRLAQWPWAYARMVVEARDAST